MNLRINVIRHNLNDVIVQLVLPGPSVEFFSVEKCPSMFSVFAPVCFLITKHNCGLDKSTIYTVNFLKK